MYTLVRRYIKTGIVFLFSGLALGAWVLVRRELFGIWPHAHLVSAHTHAVLVGFVMFVIFGVALWLFPRPPKEDRRYSPARASAAYWILTVSTGSRFLAEAARAWWGAGILPWVVVAGGLGQAVGAGIVLLDDVAAHPSGRQPPARGAGRALPGAVQFLSRNT